MDVIVWCRRVLLLLGNGGNLNLQLLLMAGTEFRHQTSHTVLELAIFGRIDERINAAVGEHQHHGEVVEPADESDNLV